VLIVGCVACFEEYLQKTKAKQGSSCTSSALDKSLKVQEFEEIVLRNSWVTKVHVMER